MESTLNSGSVVRKINTSSSLKKNILLSSISLIVVLLGIGLGYLLSGSGKTKSANVQVPGAVNTKNEAGVADEKSFPDSAEGILEEGGINGEGTHHLVRGIGPSQYAYLTSTVIDLSAFTGKKVQVWGQTIAGKKAGWLMDVGKVKVIE